jgi:hypothetical protein
MLRAEERLRIFPRCFFERPTMYRSQGGVALARRVLVSKSCFQPPRLLPLSFRLGRTLATKIAAPQQCTPIRCKSTISSAHLKGEEVPAFLRPGDWICGNCQAHNYRSRTSCFECQTSITTGRVIYKPGMWHCPRCNQSAKSSGSLSPPPILVITDL